MRAAMPPAHSLQSNGTVRTASIRLAILLATPFDCQAVSKLFASKRRLRVVESFSQVELGLAGCRRVQPDLLMLDPKVGHDVLSRASELLSKGHVSHLLVLDDRLHESRLAAALKMPATSYFTRQIDANTLQDAIVEMVDFGQRLFDPLVALRVRRTRRGLRLDSPEDQPSIAHLSARETEVMRLLAEGNSVRDCALALQLSESTIDNHKSRLMKKLRLHKVSQLTRRAIRDGLVHV